MLKLVLIPIISVGVYYAFDQDVFKPERHQEFVARVSLETNCEMDINSFGLKNLATGKTVNFKHGEAFIRASGKDELQVVMAPQFNAVRINGAKFAAGSNVEAFQDCNNQVTLENIFDSMNTQFSSN
jgi:hypothetical protein